MNKLKLVVNFRTPIRGYLTRIILKNSLKTDVRVYEMNFTVLPKPMKAFLEITVPVRKSLT